MKFSANVFVAIAATLLSASTHPATAAVLHEPHAGPSFVKSMNEPVNTSSFHVQLSRLGTDKRVSLQIENPGRKNLYVALTGPDGNRIDDFFTGKKSVSLSKIYNFSAAEVGLYSIEVRYGNEKIKKHIRLEYTERPVDKLTIE